jgi:tetratricopeptide (TPR) repeat protein
MDLEKTQPHSHERHRIEENSQRAKEFEEVGQYDRAFEELSEVWGSLGERPKVEGLSRPLQAELLHRAGSITGWLGSTRQISGAQERAKDLLTESIRAFEEVGDKTGKLSAEIDLAICYWREGALDEARVLLAEVRMACGDDPLLMMRALVNTSVVEVSADRNPEALRLLESAASFYDMVESDATKGRYQNQLGNVLTNLGNAEQKEEYIDRAIEAYYGASFHFERAGHVRNRAYVENNLGFLLYQLERYTEAHEHLDRARRLFISLKDADIVALINETRARAYLAQGFNEAAERVAGDAVHTYEQGDESGHLAQALITQGRALARLRHDEQALRVLYRAAGVAVAAGDAEKAACAFLTVIEEVSRLSDSDLLDSYQQADELLSDRVSLELLHRLRAAARKVCVAARAASISASHAIDGFLIGGTLRDEVLHFERILIKRALEEAKGVPTQAARLLGLTHQTFLAKLETKHKDLSVVRAVPPKQRRRSLITKSQTNEQPRTSKRAAKNLQ